MLNFLINNKIEKKRALKLIKRFPKAKILARGRHAAILLNGDYCIKIEKDIAAAKRTIANEAKWLKKMQKKNFAAKFRDYNKNLRYVAYEYVKGEFLPDFLRHAPPKRKRKVIEKCLKICRELDKLGINKEEMHKPLKHVIIDYPKVKFIDWERCHKVKNTKNVTQFANYLTNGKALEEAKIYKKSKNEKDFKTIMKKILQ